MQRQVRENKIVCLNLYLNAFQEKFCKVSDQWATRVEGYKEMKYQVEVCHISFVLLEINPFIPLEQLSRFSNIFFKDPVLLIFFAADLAETLGDDDPTYAAMTKAATSAMIWPQIHQGE